jgi:hypothetical protein
MLVGGEAIVSKLYGTLDGRTATTALEQALAALPGKPLLFDLRQIECELQTQDISGLVGLLMRLGRGRNLKIAVLAADKRPAVKASLFAGDARGAGHQVRLFVDLAPLCEWLGLDVSTALSRISY